MLVGLAAFIFYFITNLLVLYASRVREYFADKGSIDLGNKPSDLASALYKLVYGSARMPKEALKDVEDKATRFMSGVLKEVDPQRRKQFIESYTRLVGIAEARETTDALKREDEA